MKNGVKSLHWFVQAEVGDKPESLLLKREKVCEATFGISVHPKKPFYIIFQKAEEGTHYKDLNAGMHTDDHKIGIFTKKTLVHRKTEHICFQQLMHNSSTGIGYKGFLT